MALTSLGLASEGLLDRGSFPTRHIAVYGYLREAGDAPTPPAGGGHGASRRYKQEYHRIPLWSEDWVKERPAKKLKSLVSGKRKRTKKKQQEAIIAAIEPLEDFATDHRVAFIEETTDEIRRIAQRLQAGLTIRVAMELIAQQLEELRQFEAAMRKQRNNVIIALLLSQ